MSSEEVDILKLEYQLLTSEINFRVNARFALISIIFAIIGFIIKEKLGGVLNTEVHIYLGLFSSLLFVVWLRFAMLIYNCANHLVNIEKKINHYSAKGGEPLLTWYTEGFTNTWLMRICEKIPNKSSKKDAVNRASS
jgi:hypothetical protein